MLNLNYKEPLTAHHSFLSTPSPRDFPLHRLTVALSICLLMIFSANAMADGQGGNSSDYYGGNGAYAAPGGGGGANGLGGIAKSPTRVSNGSNGNANGNGGNGANGGQPALTDPFSAGGTGGSVGSAATSYVGGNGGNGGDALCTVTCSAGFGSAGGGGGGAGFVGSDLSTVTVAARGGNGGNGGQAVSVNLGADGGSGGGGGTGVFLTGSGTTTTNAAITGGNGGNGANAGGTSLAAANAGGAGYGGAGGSGLLSIGVNVLNSQIITGGNGGIGADALNTNYYSAGGSGGAGVNGNSFTFINTGTVQGGNGGTSAANARARGVADLGGVGIIGNNLNVVTSGAINGGLAGNTTTRANAITFNGGSNSLELQSGYSFIGAVVGTGSDSLILGGNTSDSFDLTQIGNNTGFQYSGFSQFTKTGTSTWTLNNIATQAMNWNIQAGILQLTLTTALNGGGVALSGGGLSFSNAGTFSGNVTLNQVGPINVNIGTVILNGLVSGIGGLTKLGAGNLALNTATTYDGNTEVQAGTLSLGTANAIASSAAVNIDSGTLLALGTSDQLINNLSGAGNMQGTATLTANNSSNTTYSGTFTGANLTKIGTGILTMSGNSNTLSGDILVSVGILDWENTDMTQIGGNYTTTAGATTNIGASNSQLQVGGVFTQQSGSALSVTVGASPEITADSAVLGGTLTVNGFNDGPQPVKASDATTQDYTLISTVNGITGNFTNNPLAVGGLDYLLHDGYISANSLDYDLGFRLAWTQGGQAQGVGDFTLGTGTAFDVDIALANQVGSFASGWDGQSLVKGGTGRLVLSALNGYTGSTTVNDGMLQLNIADSIKASSDVIINGGIVNLNGNNQQFNRLSGNGGEIQLNGAALTAANSSSADNSQYAGDITGNGTFVKNGAGSLTLSGKTAWVGDTELQAGSLVLDGAAGGAQLVSNIIGQSGTQLSLSHGASLTGWIDPTNVDIDASSRWTMTGNSLVDNLTNSGSVALLAPTADDFKTLTVAGNYQGNNGLLVLNTRLGDDSSLTDKLVVEGNTSGSTRVQIANAGGSGAQTLKGIEVITVGGQSDGEFVQSGRIAAGAYDYLLARGTETGQTGNWYLTSSTVNPNKLTVRPEVGTYSANLAAANNLFVTRLHDRLGETQYIDALTGEKKVTSMWLRNEGGHNRSRDTSDQLNTQANRYVVQLGGDIAQWSNNGMDRFHLGVMAGYGNSKNTTVSQVSGYNAKGTTDGYSTGVYGTWYANDADKSGLYVDSWAQYSWFDNTVEGQDLASEEYKSKGVTASVESGYTFKVGENAAKNATYFIQPKAQVTWMGVKADDHKEANGTNVSGEGDGNIQTRLGVKAFMNGYADQDKGKDRVFQPFIEANWVHNTKDFGTNMDGVTVKQDGAANIAEVKVGVEGQINKQVNLWGNVGQQVGNKGYSDTAVMLGVKYNF